ncbi:MAG: endonuclease/exonuclease/phosphatase family protein [Pseudomonadota bacterium]
MWSFATVTLAGLSLLCVITTLLPFFPPAHGLYRVFDFPRLQNATLGLVGLLATVAVFPLEGWGVVIASGFAASVLVQAWHIARFSPLWPRRSLDYVPNQDGEKAPHVRLFVSNVKQSNQDTRKTLDLIHHMEPDVALFMETDQLWADALDELKSHYRHTMRAVLSNGYGMMLYSRLRLANHQIQYLLNDEVPSFHADIVTPTGARFRFIALHPEPPVIHETTVGRDAEIMQVATIVRKNDDPVIVCGDLNDVAWSRTTRRFLRVSRLLDPREGRGMFNTFDARFFFLRWPLDHIFHSPHFQLVDMQRMPFTGSDHFPMHYTLALTTKDEPRREMDEADEQDMAEAKELIEEEKKRDPHPPIGHDWEI